MLASNPNRSAWTSEYDAPPGQLPDLIEALGADDKGRRRPDIRRDNGARAKIQRLASAEPAIAGPTAQAGDQAMTDRAVLPLLDQPHFA